MLLDFTRPRRVAALASSTNKGRWLLAFVIGCASEAAVAPAWGGYEPAKVVSESALRSKADLLAKPRLESVDEEAAPALLADLERPPVELAPIVLPDCAPERPGDVCTQGLPLTAIALLNTSRLEARGHSFPGALYQREMLEGERAELSLLADDVCRTVIAHAGGAVMEVDVFLSANKDGERALFGKDQWKGPSAVVGGRAGCLTAPANSNDVKAIVRVRKGRGLVVLGVYEARTPVKADALSPLP